MALSLELWRRVLFVALRRWGVTEATAAKSYSCVLTPQCNGYLNRRDLSPPPGWMFRLPSASCGVATKSTCRCPNGWSTRPGAIAPSALLSTTRNEPPLEIVPAMLPAPSVCGLASRPRCAGERRMSGGDFFDRRHKLGR